MKTYTGLNPEKAGSMRLLVLLIVSSLTSDLYQTVPPLLPLVSTSAQNGAMSNELYSGKA